MPFKPGLVGGHCIGVDPYYLTHKAQAIGYEPEIILAGRRLNDRMASYVTDRLITALGGRGIPIKGSKVLIMGLTFKENCPDLRNTGVFYVYRELTKNRVKVDFYDPWVDAKNAELEYGITTLLKEPKHAHYDAIILAVAHKEFIDMRENEIRVFGKENHILYDLKYVLPIESSDIRL
jgi:UDP-N-acetyl-D-galactosamine dehydrogenase